MDKLPNEIDNDNYKEEQKNHENEEKIDKAPVDKKPSFYLFIYNIQCKNNIETLIKSATCFGSKKFFALSKSKDSLEKIVDRKFYSLKNKIEFEYFENLGEIKEYAIKNNMSICGVEIGANCIPIQNHPFKGDTIFIMGNEGMGMNQKSKDICDNFVYIQQYSEKTGSLNVAIAASIIFHHFAVWAGYGN